MLINRPNRWKNWNYNYNGFYFVTICTKDRYEYFGKIKNKTMVLNDIGNIIKNNFYNNIYIKIYEYCIMPNHVHILLQINDNYINNNPIGVNNDPVGARLIWHLRNEIQNNKTGVEKFKIWNTQSRNNELLSLFIGLFKAGVSRQINKIKPNYFCWQKSFHDHIIRDNKQYEKIKYYIKSNPEMWNRDRNNQHRTEL